MVKVETTYSHTQNTVNYTGWKAEIQKLDAFS